jgi:hypothetical protein
LPGVKLAGGTTAFAVAGLLALPGSASAVCALTSLEKLARQSPVVVTAKAQPGPLAQSGVGLLSPATFRVVAYDQGSGPQEIKVQTALTTGANGLVAMSEGVNPLAGQTWRLWGSIAPDGSLQTSVCAGSVLAGAQGAPTLSAGRRSTTMRVASFAGVPRRGALPTLAIRRGTKALLRLPSREATGPMTVAQAGTIVALRTIRGTITTSVLGSWSGRDGVMSTKLPAGSGTATVVVITRSATYAAKLRAV